MREHSLYLKDMLEAITAIEKFFAGIESEDFKNDLVWHTIKDVIPQVKPIIQEIMKDIIK